MTFNAPINLIQMNRSIHLHYCFRKPNSYSVQLHDTKFYTSFKASKFPCLTAAHLLNFVSGQHSFVILVCCHSSFRNMGSCSVKIGMICWQCRLLANPDLEQNFALWRRLFDQKINMRRTSRNTKKQFTFQKVIGGKTDKPGKLTWFYDLFFPSKILSLGGPYLNNHALSGRSILQDA